MYRHISSGVESGSCKVVLSGSSPQGIVPGSMSNIQLPSLDWLRAGVCFIGSISSVRDRCALQMAIRKPPLDRSIAGS